jgi:hypothetical protein
MQGIAGGKKPIARGPGMSAAHKWPHWVDAVEKGFDSMSCRSVRPLMVAATGVRWR